MNSGPYLKVSELSELIGVGAREIYHHIDKGALPVMRLPGGDVRVHRNDASVYAERPDLRWQPPVLVRADRPYRPKSGVYFVQAGSLVKIGGSGQLQNRWLALRAVIPIPTRLLGVVERADWRPLEALLHRRFSQYRKGATEWFLLCDDLAEYVRTEARMPAWGESSRTSIQ